MNKNQSTGIIIIVAIILIALLSIAFEGPTTSTSEISYSQFLNKVQLEQIESVTIAKDTLTAIPKEQSIEKQQNKEKVTKKTVNENPLLTNNKIQQKIPKMQYKVQIPYNDEELYELLKDKNV